MSCLAEAKAYLDHSVLGPRLLAAVACVQASPATSVKALFGSPDDQKFRSSMTLFAAAAPDGPYQAALEPWRLDGLDPRTLRLLAQ